MANYQKIPNITGSGRDLLKNVPYVAPKPDSADKVPSNQKELVKSIQKLLDEAAKSQRLNKIMGDSRQADVILMRIASLLETLKLNQTSEELESAKKEILGKVESIAAEGFISKLVKEYLAKQIVDLFEQPATKDDIEDLKAYLAEVAESTRAFAENHRDEQKPQVEGSREEEEEKTSESETPQEVKAKDEKEGDYVDSTPAKNFFTVQTFIGKQFERLNATLAKVSTPKMTAPAAARKQNKTMAVFGKIGAAVMKVLGFMKDVIYPIVENIKGLITKFVVIPVTLIAAKILLIIATIGLIIVGAILIFNWVKKKIMEFVDYVMSGKLWEDIKAGMLKAWDWLVDFSKWIWDITVKALKFIFVDIWVELGKWIWEKLCQFGNWLYDNYIDKYLVQPFKKYIWEPVKKLWNEKIWPKIEPFVISLTKLKNSIVKAFSAWDTNKSIWENLKNISGIIKDAVVSWWNDSPFKVFYEKHIQPFVKSAADLFKHLKNLGGFIKQAILDWWNGDSSLGDTLKNIGTTVWNTVKEWWSGSVFKEYWDKLVNYLDNLLKPLKDWWNESWLGQTFAAAWDSLKSAWDRFMDWWEKFSLVDTIKEWYESTFLHQWITQIKEKGFGTFIKDAMTEWYKQSWLKQVIDKIQELMQVYIIAPINGIKRKIAAFVAKLSSEFVIKVPSMNFNDSIKPWNWTLDWNEFHPFDFATKNWTPAQKQAALADADKSATDLIQEEMEKTRKILEQAKPNVVLNEANSKVDVQQVSSTVTQVVNQQMQPIQEMEKSKVEENTMVNESFASVAKARELEQKKQEEQQTWQSSQTYEMFQFMKDMRSEMKDGFANPQVVPAPVVITNNNGPNPAMMENR